ncbi:MAG TPA: hypothetical protein VK324_15175 [Tepidisphaeraceae bacterium]|nr:hypothetical protein [Tepidisphaeraceae bacterium]
MNRKLHAAAASTVVISPGPKPPYHAAIITTGTKNSSALVSWSGPWSNPRKAIAAAVIASATP